MTSEIDVSAMYIASTTNEESIVANTSRLIVPNFLLAGAQKAGTSALAHWLYHGGYGICSAKPLTSQKYHEFRKEVHFFDSSDFKRGPEYYTSLFSHCSPSDLVMDATPDYAIHSTRIRDFYESPSVTLNTNATGLKVIMILRDPVSRELSWYNHKKDMFLQATNRSDTRAFWYNIVKDPENGTAYSFDEYTNEYLLRVMPGVRKTKEAICEGLMCRSMYSHFLLQWFQWMPRKQILILSYDELMSDPLTFKKRVGDFLGLQNISHAELTKANTHSNPEKITLPSCKSRDRLERALKRWNKRLYALLERNPGPPMEQFPFPKFKASACDVENPV